jgi:pimeloyl-ACP methyl ester carboxylesterase
LAAGSGGPPETVVLLHGLMRRASSMRPLALRLEREGFAVRNVGYPSWRLDRERLLARLDSELAPWRGDGTGRVHFVTHSLGGILLRAWLEREPLAALGRVVMLAPPNAGSEVVDRLGAWRMARVLLGPTGQLLGTREGAWPGGLPPAGFEVGIIAGTRSINPLFSVVLPGENDGSVSVASTRLAGAAGFLTVPHTHTFIMRSRRVHDEVIGFLRTGRFPSQSHGH